jgi:hypothetical protein
MRVRKRSFRKFARPRRNDRENPGYWIGSPLSNSAACTAPHIPNPKLKRDRALTLLTLSEPPPIFSLALLAPRATARHPIALYETA